MFKRTFKQKNIATCCLGVALLLCCSAVSAKADVFTDWTLEGFTFGGGGTVTGTFTYDNTNNSITNWDLTVQAGTAGNGLNIPGSVSVTSFVYTTADSGTLSPGCGVPTGTTVDAGGGFEVDTCTGGRESSLHILWNSALHDLPATGGTIGPGAPFVEEDFAPTSSDITPQCSSGNPTFEPCVEYFRDANGGTLVGTPESTTTAPEPETWLLLASGLPAFLLLRRKWNISANTRIDS